LDRLALAMGALLALFVVAVIGVYHGHVFYGAIGVVALWALFHRYLSARRTIDSDDVLIAKALQLSKLFPAAFVVMGHTHTPVHVPVGDATYINVGSWTEDEGAGALQDGTPRAPRTHLVIHAGEARPEAGLFVWESGVGPRRYETG